MKEEFKPLPSDLIMDPKAWPEWKLDDKMRVVKKEGSRDMSQSVSNASRIT